MCSTKVGGVEAAVHDADTALTRALHEGVDQLTHDQSAALLQQLRAIGGNVDALTLAIVEKVDADGHWTLQRLPDGRYRLTHPDGRTLGPEPARPGHNRPPPAPPSDEPEEPGEE